jgi:hypothetical protein
MLKHLNRTKKLQIIVRKNEFYFRMQLIRILNSTMESNNMLYLFKLQSNLTKVSNYRDDIYNLDVQPSWWGDTVHAVWANGVWYYCMTYGYTTDLKLT